MILKPVKEASGKAARTKKPVEQRRKDLVDAARKTFGEKGFKATTVSAIVKEAGVAQGTFYLYFDSKEEILKAVGESVAGAILNVIRVRVDDPALSAPEKIRAIFDLPWDVPGVEERLVSEFHSETYRQYHDQLAGHMVTLMVPLLAEVIEQGVSEGVFHVRNAELSALFILAPSLHNIAPGEGRSYTLDQYEEAYGEFVFQTLGFDGNVRPEKTEG